jgi:hypothetical protein
VQLNLGADETFPMDELRALYADADDALFKKAVKLFDWSAKGAARRPAAAMNFERFF